MSPQKDSLPIRQPALIAHPCKGGLCFSPAGRVTLLLGSPSLLGPKSSLPPSTLTGAKPDSSLKRDKSGRGIYN